MLENTQTVSSTSRSGAVVKTQHLTAQQLTSKAPELWRAVPGFPAYEVSNLGHVRNATTGEAVGNRYRPGIQLPSVRLYFAGKEYERSIRDLMSAAFMHRRLTDAEVTGIRTAYLLDSVPGPVLARDYLLPLATIYAVARGQSYVHVPMPTRPIALSRNKVRTLTADPNGRKTVSALTVKAVLADHGAGYTIGQIAYRNEVSPAFVQAAITGKIRRVTNLPEVRKPTTTSGTDAMLGLLG